MKTRHRALLVVDGVVNLLLGVLLLLAPAGTLRLFGLPPGGSYFYATILGAVIFGVGLALLLERFGAAARVRGLGLGGAIAINLCGGGALVVWLIVEPLALPLRGSIILWAVAAVVLGVGGVELLARAWRYEE